MKKFDFKNYIAFTLAEMTLVLLITSIIAAAATPVVTSAISGANSGKNANDIAAQKDVIWKKTNAYNGGGIYNSPILRTSMVSINHLPSANPETYGYPSLLVNQFLTNNLAKDSQIKIVPRNGAPLGTYTSIAMDEFQNVAVTYGTSFQKLKQSNAFMGINNVFLGDYILKNTDGNVFLSNVFMGYGIDTAKYANHSVFVGSNIYAGAMSEIKNIYIGNDIKTGTPDYLGMPWYYTIQYETSGNNILIGSNVAYGGTPLAEHNIFMGYYAGSFRHLSNLGNSGSRNIAIGNYAGKDFSYGSNGYGGSRTDNIIIGSFAGFNESTYSPKKTYRCSTCGYEWVNDMASAPVKCSECQSSSISVSDSKIMSNVIIGNYAGFTVSPYAISVSKDNVMIGSYAGHYNQPSAYGAIPVGNVYIGEYAGAYKYVLSGTWSNNVKVSNTDSLRQICIGKQACNSYAHRGPGTGNSNHVYHGPDSIYIGNYAGMYACDYGKNIGIGKYAGAYSNNVPEVRQTINIGNYAGYKAQGNYSIYIGYYAGYNSSTGATDGYRYANVGIGKYACSGVTKGGKWCLGYGTLSSNRTYTNSAGTAYSVWTKSDNSYAQMVIGFADKSTAGGTYITFYASRLYNGKQGNHIWKTSDRRLKKDIVPSKRSLKDIRKINIYDFNYKKDKSKKTITGIIAQEYRKVFPHDVSVEPTTKKLSASSDWLLYTLVNAIKDLDKEIADVKNDLDNYIKGYLGLKAKVEKLEKHYAQVKEENNNIKAHLAKINTKLK